MQPESGAPPSLLWKLITHLDAIKPQNTSQHCCLHLFTELSLFLPEDVKLAEPNLVEKPWMEREAEGKPNPAHGDAERHDDIELCGRGLRSHVKTFCNIWKQTSLRIW